MHSDTDVTARALVTIEAARARADAATPHPWRECGGDWGGCQCGNVWSIPADAPVATTDTDSEADGFSSTTERKTTDARFIAHARADVPLPVVFAAAGVRWLRWHLCGAAYRVGDALNDAPPLDPERQDVVGQRIMDGVEADAVRGRGGAT